MFLGAFRFLYHYRFGANRNLTNHPAQCLPKRRMTQGVTVIFGGLWAAGRDPSGSW